MKNQIKIIVVICAAIGFALFIGGCPANPTQNSGNNSNGNTANVSNKPSIIPLVCPAGQCQCGGECQDPPCNPGICSEPSNGNANTNANGNANSNVNRNANSNANVR